MCTCVCVCVCVCTHRSLPTCVCACACACVCVCLCTHLGTPLHLYVPAFAAWNVCERYICIRMWVSEWVRACVCVCVCLCLCFLFCVCVCVFCVYIHTSIQSTCTCMYRHTRAHTHTQHTHTHTNRRMTGKRFAVGTACKSGSLSWNLQKLENLNHLSISPNWASRQIELKQIKNQIFYLLKNQITATSCQIEKMKKQK